jgi:hypothetical protein
MKTTGTRGRQLAIAQFRPEIGRGTRRTAVSIAGQATQVPRLSAGEVDHTDQACRREPERDGAVAQTWRLLLSFWTSSGKDIRHVSIVRPEALMMSYCSRTRWDISRSWCELDQKPGLGVTLPCRTDGGRLFRFVRIPFAGIWRDATRSTRDNMCHGGP